MAKKVIKDTKTYLLELAGRLRGTNETHETYIKSIIHKHQSILGFNVFNSKVFPLLKAYFKRSELPKWSQLYAIQCSRVTDIQAWVDTLISYHVIHCNDKGVPRKSNK